MRPFGRALALGALVALASWPTPVAAQTAAEKAQAQLLFDEGRKLTEAGKLVEACEAFDESQKLDPAIGTQLNLANCYEKIGRTASAWIMYLEVKTKAIRAGQEDRAKYAEERAAALEPNLSKMRVEVSEPVAGLTITRNGTAVAGSAIGKPIPVDPGEHVIEAVAPGKKAWTTTIEVGEAADEVSVQVPALEDAPIEKPIGPVGPGPDAVDGTPQLVSGFALMGVGVLAGVGGAVLRVFALQRDEESFEHCRVDDPGVCTQQGADLRDEAQTLQTGSVIAWAGGGALLVTGLVLVLTAPGVDSQDGEDVVSWSFGAGPDGARASLSVSW
jgi:hypothetical protein